jgi:hypothetical protein
MPTLQKLNFRNFILLTLAVAPLLLFGSIANGQSLIGFWDFNDGFDVGNDQVQLAHSATMGNGTIYQQLADIDGNGKGGNAFADAIFGINTTAGQGIAWDDVAKSGANDAEMFIEFSTLGFQDIEISFDMQGNDEAGILSYDLKYDNNPLVDILDPNGSGVTIKDFTGGNSTTLANNQAVTTSIDSYFRYTIDLSTVTAANNQTAFAFRFDDVQDNDDWRLDNFLVTGTAVPEPSSLAFCILAGSMLMVRRKR